MLGVLRHTVFWAEKLGSFVGAFAHQACGTVRPWSEMHTALGSARRWVALRRFSVSRLEDLPEKLTGIGGRLACVFLGCVGQTLERRNVELLILSVTFLKKLSVYKENKDKMHECGLVARLAHFVPVPNEVLQNAVLRLLVRDPTESIRSISVVVALSLGPTGDAAS